jgi:hypothetical protein
VPLDYTDPTVGTLDLEILRLKSSSITPKGSIFLNFGGPGDNGRESFDALGLIMQSITGGCYDLISIVPRYVPVEEALGLSPHTVLAEWSFDTLTNNAFFRRGTNNTMLFDCYGNDATRAAAPVPPSGNASDVAIDTIWAQSTVFTETCAVRQNATGRFVGTAFTARDHKAVLDTLGEDGLFRYWGK